MSEPCKGNHTCCNRDEFSRTMFPCKPDPTPAVPCPCCGRTMGCYCHEHPHDHPDCPGRVRPDYTPAPVPCSKCGLRETDSANANAAVCSACGRIGAAPVPDSSFAAPESNQGQSNGSVPDAEAVLKALDRQSTVKHGGHTCLSGEAAELIRHLQSRVAELEGVVQTTLDATEKANEMLLPFKAQREAELAELDRLRAENAELRAAVLDD